MLDKAFKKVREGQDPKDVLNELIEENNGSFTDPNDYTNLEEVRDDFRYLFRTEAFFQGTRSHEAAIQAMAEKVAEAFEDGKFKDQEGLRMYMMSIL